ncbi:hypothetical protein C8A01DRAFT_21228, partial [Parachaetomium inaequale]
KRLVEALYTLIDCKTIEELYNRQDTTINIVTIYCKYPRVSSAKEASVNVTFKVRIKDPLKDSLLDKALLSVFKKKLYRCFLYVRKARSVREDDTRFVQLVHEFHSPGDITKYFQCKHLKNL